MGCKVIAHRGANKKAPQNTAPAFITAINEGTDGFETDVHITKDGEIVICHNYTINETSTGTGRIAEMRLEELKRYDFGSYFSKEFEGVTLNINTLKFPDHFHRTNKDLRHVAEVTDSELRASIKQAIDFFRANKDEWSWFTMYGDLFLQVYRFDGDEEYSIVIARDFYEATLPFEAVDYNK
jgi:glycerophosphoryl diester phosphodiesterase